MSKQELSQCCNAPGKYVGMGDFGEDDVCTVSKACSKCGRSFIPKYICHKCGIYIGTGKPKGLMDRIEKRGYCGLCEKVGLVVPPSFYNIK